MNEKILGLNSHSKNAEKNGTTDLDSKSSSYATEFYDCQGGSVQSEKGDKDQESIQSSTTPDLGYHMGKRQKHN